MPNWRDPCSLYVPESRERILTATPEHDDDAERIACHRRMCRRLAVLGMDLAEAAAARALQTLSTPPGPDPDPDPEAAHKPARPQPDHGLLFVRVSRSVHQSIALETSIAAGPPAMRRATQHPEAPPRRPAARRADPRRAPIQDAVKTATASDPDRTLLRRETSKRLEEELAADPDQTIKLHDLFAILCDEFSLEVNYAKLSNELIGLTDINEDGDDDDDDDDDLIPPHPD